MSLHPDLHKILVSRQSTRELERKRNKAARKNWWTQEDFDYAKRAGLMLHLKLTKILESARNAEKKEELKQHGYILALKEQCGEIEIYETNYN